MYVGEVKRTVRLTEGRSAMIPTTTSEVAALFVGGQEDVLVASEQYSETEQVFVLRVGTYVAVIGDSPFDTGAVIVDLHNHATVADAAECHAFKVWQVGLQKAMVGNGAPSASDMPTMDLSALLGQIDGFGSV